MTVTKNVLYVGVNDKKIDLFEGQYKVPNGMSYNSYLIIDEKCAVMDTVDASFTDEWLSNLECALSGRVPDYLVVQHVEPDHSASIIHFMKKYPEAIIVATAKAFAMIKAFYGDEFEARRVVVSNGDSLSLGSHTLSFVTAPMVHWPEVMVSYEASEKILFSADAFGKFGALDAEDNWFDEARRYYIGIVGKYGVPVQALLKKAATLDIDMICPLHGPVLSENLGRYIEKYDIWSSYRAEEDGILIAYTSIYGNTKAAALMLLDELTKRGTNAKIFDLARCDMAEAVSEAFRYSKLVLATTTYNADIFPFMKEFINHLTERGFSNRRVALVENGSWAPMAAKVMRGMLEPCKNLVFAENAVTIRSALDEVSKTQIVSLAEELSK